MDAALQKLLSHVWSKTPLPENDTCKHGNYQNLLEKLRLLYTIELSEHENGKVTEMHYTMMCLTGGIDRSASPRWCVDWVIDNCMNDQRGGKKKKMAGLCHMCASCGLHSVSWMRCQIRAISCDLPS